ncbi:MAG: hypothetical protein F6K16_12410 [Symploca sp. SIO2B6]|nr:hypothetical protein [Symploca sp. SIO2B6]
MGRWGDGETRRHGDMETRRHGDTETRRQNCCTGLSYIRAKICTASSLICKLNVH